VSRTGVRCSTESGHAAHDSITSSARGEERQLIGGSDIFDESRPSATDRFDFSPEIGALQRSIEFPAP
jgi:hypothetical protein